MYPVTKEIILAYVAGAVTHPGLLAAIEEARLTDPQVQYWIDIYNPDADDELPPADEGDRVRRLERWIRNAPSAAAPPDMLVPAEFLQDDRGTLLYREPYLATGADQHTISVPPLDVPCIYPDYNRGRLVIQQALDRIRNGQVEVLVVRRRGENEVVTFPSRRIQLECTEPPDGPPYWYADLPLKSLTGDFRPGDDFVYCVAVAAPAE